MEIIIGVERRRRWSIEEKLRIVAETEQPGCGIAECPSGDLSSHLSRLAAELAGA
jgi:transposase-like protein